MYYIKKHIEISASHQLDLDYKSKCEHLHGHNWSIIICLKSMELDANGMIMDYSHIKKKIADILDHQHLNDQLGEINPTAENIARWICHRIGDKCYRVEVSESKDNIAIYERDII